MIVFVPKYGIEGPVYLTPRPDKPNNNNTSSGGGGSSAAAPAAAAAATGAAGPELRYVLDDAAQTVTSLDGSVRYALFDKCAVRIEVVEGEGHRRQLALTLVDRALLPEAERMG